MWKQLGMLQSEEELIDRLLVAFGKKAPSMTAPAPSSLQDQSNRMYVPFLVYLCALLDNL